MFKKPQYIALWVVVLFVLVFLNLPSQTTNRLKLAIGSLFVPLFGLSRSAQQMTANVTDTLVPRSELIRKSELLQRENDLIKLQLAQSQDAVRENARFRQLYNWQPRAAWKPRLAKVVLREPSNWWRTIQIDLGSRDGMKINLPILSQDGFLVGRISSVSLTRSQIVLIGDSNCRVSAFVENAARDQGVLMNSSSTSDNALVPLGYLPRIAVLKPGQNVLTSGLGGIFPRGISIGKIVDSEQANYGLQTEARVKLSANLSALEEVWVLTEPK